MTSQTKNSILFKLSFYRTNMYEFTSDIVYQLMNVEYFIDKNS